MSNKRFSIHIDVDLDQMKKEVANLKQTTDGMKAFASDPIPFLEKCGIKLDNTIIKHIRKKCADVVAKKGHLIKV